MKPPSLVIYEADEWSALYVDGKLERVGDSYYVEEKAFELAGVTVIQDDAFMRGQDRREGVAKSLDEIIVFKSQRDLDQKRANELREQAAELLAKADALGGANGS